MITAKIKLESKQEQGGQVLLTFAPDYAPGLSLTMGVKDEVAERFEVGGAYTLTFTPSED